MGRQGVDVWKDGGMGEGKQKDPEVQAPLGCSNGVDVLKGVRHGESRSLMIASPKSETGTLVCLSHDFPRESTEKRHTNKQQPLNY